MVKKKTDKESNKDTAEEVVASKRLYFVPSQLKEFEADENLKGIPELKKEEDGDGDR